MTDPEAPVRFHPVDPGLAANPMAALAALSAQCPVSRQTHATLDPVTLVAAYEPAMAVFLRRDSFSNRYGHAIAATPGELFDRLTVFTMDGEPHRRMRRILVAAPTPRSVEAATSDRLEAILEAARACPNFAITVELDGRVVYDPLQS
jgi:cytochrome P450